MSMPDEVPVPEVPSATDLLAAAASEARALAGQMDAATRKRLLVVAHAAELVAREIAAGKPPDRSDDSSRRLAAAIRAGAHDSDLAAVTERVRDEVRQRIAVNAPDYDT
jgi:Domain of unknown function (DUF6285)